jgi:hypothetical protein
MPEQLERVQELLGNGYLVQRELGHGGMSCVYLAHDFRRDGPVAVKVLRPELAATVATARFVREVDILRHLDHPHILSVYESGSRDGDLYYTMPFVDGPTLRARLQDEPQLPLEEAVAISRQVASALAYAHAHGVIHRDIKPGNILLGADGVMVADFGIARAITAASSTSITASNIVLGTPLYMSPEQGSGDREIDGRADIYALGCVMYEMVVGEPPFTGATAQVVVARQCGDSPRSLRVARPSVPVALERLIMKTLEKVPADRFATADDLIQALDAVDLAHTVVRQARVGVRWRVATGAVFVACAIAVGWRLARAPPALDPNRIVIFPLHDQRPSEDGTSEAVATYIGYALDKTEPLQWLEAWDLTNDRAQDLSRLEASAARRLSARAHAAYYIDGKILRRSDSATVVLYLHSVRGDSVLGRAGVSDSLGADLPRLGLLAVGGLLRALLVDLRPGREWWTRAGHLIGTRPPSENTTAVANFLQGEREYRHMQFPAALAHYQAAVVMDSAFAIAAFKGAQTATWLSRPGIDTVLIDVALRRERSLTPPQALLAKGLRAYLTGNADSAVSLIRGALRADSTLPGAWTLLGEVYSRSLASEPAADSLARAALRKARLIDPGFAPTLVLLEEMALRDGDLREGRLLRDDLRRAGADTTHASERGVMWTCVEKGVTHVDWDRAARENPSATLDAGRVLARGVAQPACARAAFAAVFRSDSASLAQRKGALLGLNGLLLAAARMNVLRAVMASRRPGDLRLWQLYLEDAARGVGFEREASAAADSIGSRYATMAPPVLWLLGGWAAHRGNAPELREIVRALHSKADSTHARRDELIAQLVDARLTLTMGYTDSAIAQLRALKPSGARRDIAWLPWEGLGAERLLLAELLAAQGKYRDAIQVASMLDATEPVPYLLYARPSLALRLRAARAVGDAALTAQYGERLKRLDR